MIQDLISRLIVNENEKSIYQNLSLGVDKHVFSFLLTQYIFEHRVRLTHKLFDVFSAILHSKEEYNNNLHFEKVRFI